MQPVTTRTIRKTSEKAYAGIKVTIRMNNDRHEYWKDIQPIFKKIISEEVLMLRILINKTIYNSRFCSAHGLKSRSLDITTLKSRPGTWNYVIFKHNVAFNQVCGTHKYKIYECHLDETL